MDYKAIDMSKMSTDELNKELQKGIEQIEMGKTLPLEQAIEKKH